MLYLIIYTLYINFCAILSTRNRDMLIPEIPKKYNYSATYWAIFNKSWQTSIYVRISLNIKFLKILCISSRATLATKFLSHTHRHTDIQTHRHTDRHTFLKNSQIVFRTSQNVSIHQKPKVESLHETNTSKSKIQWTV